MNIPRIYDDLAKYIKPGKALVIYGPRRVGKTTIMENFLSKCKLKYRLATGDDISVQNILGSQNMKEILEYTEDYELIAIDEAQKIENIGIALKMIVDHCPKIRIIATGSSSFELAGQIGEPLTGRKTTLTLYPAAQMELKHLYNKHDLKEKLPEYLVYGAYPDIIAAGKPDEKAALLHELVNSYLLRDILELEKVKGSKILMDLLRLLAFQVGNEVSLTELSKHLGIDCKTVGRYIDLFEKSFILYNLRGFSRNLRNEVSKKGKYYFYDNGIRNAVIANFNSLELRNDTGALWENFLFTERLKKQAYCKILCNNFFWRTWDQKEIDFIEERDGKLYGYEFKWGDKAVKIPRGWKENYPDSEFMIINKNNYLEFIT